METIPRRVIQTGKSRNLPLLARAAAANLQLLNPQFEYLFFDDAQVEDFIDSEFPQYRPVFDGFPIRIQRYDFFRYLAVYRYGGFYFDLDVFLARSLDELRAHACVFPFEELSLHSFLLDAYGMDWEIGNYAFGATAGHPFLATVIENCVRAQQEPAWAEPMWRSIPRLFREAFYVLDTTGPGLVTRTLAETPNASEKVTVLFPHDVCDSSTWHQFGDFGVHLHEGSWRSKSGFLQRRLDSMWEVRERSKSLAASRRLGPKRSLVFQRSGA